MRFILVIAVALALFAPAVSAQKLEIRPGAKMPERETNKFPAPEDVAEPPKEATTTESGLSWKRLGDVTGEGEPPGLNDRVGVRYTGWQTDGTMFDTTETNQVARYFRVNGVIAGFEQELARLAPPQRNR